jgi:tripartite-type tricarboxylate transporter receptor subunit TctC
MELTNALSLAERPGHWCNRRELLAGLAALSITASFAQTQSQQDVSFPARPITLIVPWPTGGSTDISLRILAEQAAKILGQPIVVDNRPGAGGSMAMPALQNAKPDGYLLAQLPQTVFRIGFTQKVLWDAVRDTTPIVQISGYTFGILVAADSEFRSVSDILVWAKKNPRMLTVGSNGVGTTPHGVMEELMARNNLSYTHVPYKGTTEQMLAVASGHLMVGVNSTGFAPYVESGKLRLLATFGDKRSKRWADAPTMNELGYGISATSPYGIVGPKGLSPLVVSVLHEAFKTAMHSSQHQQEISKYDQELSYLGPKEYGQSLSQTYEREREWAQRLVAPK